MRPKVLVVEDDVQLAELFAAVLGECFAVLTAGSYQEAVAQLQANEVAVVVTDLNLGASGSGLDLARWIKAQQPYLCGRIILLTGDVAPDAGDLPCKVLAKPVNMEYLLQVVAEVVGGSCGTSE